MSVELLVDYVTGQLGGPGDQSFTANIVRVIIAGNCITDQPLQTQQGTKKVKVCACMATLNVWL